MNHHQSEIPMEKSPKFVNGYHHEFHLNTGGGDRDIDDQNEDDDYIPPLPTSPPPALFDEYDFACLDVDHDDDDDDDEHSDDQDDQDDDDGTLLIDSGGEMVHIVEAIGLHGIEKQLDNNKENGLNKNDEQYVLEFLDHANSQAECKLAARRQARAEAREIRMRELERMQKMADENADKVYDAYNSDITNKISRVNGGGGGSNGRNTSLTSSPISNNSRRSSEDSLEESLNYRDMKLEIKDAEEKFRKAMIQNAQLDNEKAAATYQVELYLDKHDELEERFSLLQLDFKEKSREYEQLKRLFAQQKDELSYYKSELEERDRLIQENGLVLLTVDETLHNEDGDIDFVNGEYNKEQNGGLLVNGSGAGGNEEVNKSTRRVLVSSTSAELLSDISVGSSLDVKLKRFAQERKELLEELSRINQLLEEERKRFRNGSSNSNVVNGSYIEDCDDIQKEANRLAGDYKFKWQKAEQDISTLQANVARLESQVIRYKSAAETSEKVEDELKVEKRKLQRELREAQCRIEELETTNTHLQRRLDKLKNAKSALLKEI